MIYFPAMAKSSRKVVVGIDLGGTKILAAVADSKARILAETRLDTEAKKGLSKVMSNVKIAVLKALWKARTSLKNVTSICIGAPGPIIYKKGLIVSPPNMPGWGKVNLKDRIKRIFKKPVFMENDANLAAFAEAVKGAGKGMRNVVYFTLSTGIGGGIVLDGRIFRGKTGGAGEVGHMVIEKEGIRCGCGGRGCLEAMGSGTAVARMAQKRAPKSSRMIKLAGGKRSNITTEIVGQAARKGDTLAKNILREVGGNIGIGVANIVNILNPDIVVLGGGLTNLWDIIHEPIMRAYKNQVLEVPGAGVKIKKAKLGGYAGVIGAVLFALDPK